MAKSIVLENIEPRQTRKKYRYFKAKVLENNQIDGTDKTLQQAIDSEKTIVFTCKNTSYVTIADYVE